MIWDFVEGNLFFGVIGNFFVNVEWVYKVVECFVLSNSGCEV